MKKLTNITVTHAPGKVGVQLEFEAEPAELYLLPAAAAEKLRDRLDEALDLCESNGLPGSDVGLSDHAAVSILPPKGALQ